MKEHSFAITEKMCVEGERTCETEHFRESWERCTQSILIQRLTQNPEKDIISLFLLSSHSLKLNSILF